MISTTPAGNRCNSCGQSSATASLPAQERAASSSGTSTTVNPPRCSLVSTYGPSVKTGCPSLLTTLQIAVEASIPPSPNTKTPAAFISSRTAREATLLARNSSGVWSGTHSSLNAIRYFGTAVSSRRDKGRLAAPRLRRPDGHRTPTPRTGPSRSDIIPDDFPNSGPRSGCPPAPPRRAHRPLPQCEHRRGDLAGRGIGDRGGGLLEDEAARPGDLAGDRLAVADGEERVATAVYDERGDFDLRQAFTPPGRAVEPGEHHAQLVGHLDCRCGAGRAVPDACCGRARGDGVVAEDLRPGGGIVRHRFAVGPVGHRTREQSAHRRLVVVGKVVVGWTRRDRAGTDQGECREG